MKIYKIGSYSTEFKNIVTFCFLFPVNEKNLLFVEGKSFDRINMAEWIWPKNLYMTEKITPTNMNDGIWPIMYDSDKH